MQELMPCQEPEPRAGTTPRAVCAYLVVGLFVSLQFVLQGVISLMVPDLKADLGMTEASVGMLSSLFFYPYVLLQIPAGRLLSLLGARTLMVLAGLLMSLGCLIQGWSDNATQMMIGRFLMGVGAAPGIICFLRTVECSFPPLLFGLFASGMEVFGMFGAGVGDFLIPSGLESLGWQGIFKLFSVLVLLPVVGSFLFLRDDDREDTSSGSENGVDDGVGRNSHWQAVFRKRDVWLAALYSGLMFAVMNAFAALWAIPFLDSDPACVGRSGHIVGMAFIGAAVGTPIMGWLGDHHLNIRRTMLACGIGSIGLMLVLLSGYINIDFYYLVMFLLGLCASSYMLPFVLMNQWLRGEQLTIGLALTNGVSVLIGALIYQPVIGWLISFYPEVCLANYQQVLLIIPAGAILACLLVIYLSNPVKQMQGMAADS